MADAEVPDMPTQGMGVHQVLELFDQQLTALSANVDDAKLREATAREALEIATDELRSAQQARDARAVTYDQAGRDVRISARWLEDGRKAAIAALHTLNVPASETFVGQTLIEGGTEEEAQDAIKNVRRLNEALELGDRNRLIVLGSFPVRAAFMDMDKGYESTYTYNGVSFVDLTPVVSVEPPGFHVGLERENGSHFLRVSAAQVTQIPFNPLSVLEGAERDTTKHHRYVNANPLDVRVVTTDEELAELTQGQELDDVPKKYGAITVGTEKEDSFPPTVIAGEAADKFTEWLARNEWLRAMVYVATADASGKAERVPELPEGSEALAKAQVAFRQRLTFQVNRMTTIGRSREDKQEAITSLLSEPLLQPHVQQYLGISDETITKWLIEDLESDVTVEVPNSFNPDREIQFTVDNHSQLGRYFSSVEEMCDLIGQNLEVAGFGSEVMSPVARGIKALLLSRNLRVMRDDNSRASRKARAAVSRELEAIQAAPSSNQSK